MAIKFSEISKKDQAELCLAFRRYKQDLASCADLMDKRDVPEFRELHHRLLKQFSAMIENLDQGMSLCQAFYQWTGKRLSVMTEKNVHRHAFVIGEAMKLAIKVETSNQKALSQAQT
jgi:hypothetical protein